jgi:thioredoxin-related protein
VKNAIRWFNAPRMLAILIFVIVTSSAKPAVSAMAPPSAESLVDAAVKNAKSQDKIVLVHFGASWCVWCRHLDDMLQGPELGKLFADHFVIVHLTVQESDDKKQLENPGAEQLLAREGAGKSGVPVFMFFDQTGKKIADSLALPNRANIGYPASPEEIEAFGGILEKTTPRMTAAQRVSIIDYLKAHAPAPEPAK